MSEARLANATTPLRLALVGCGAIGRGQHLPVLRAHPDFSLRAVIDPQAVGIDLPCYPDLDAAMAAGIAIDAVSIATPPQVRAELAHQAIAKGLAVLLEKPPAATVAAARALPEAAHVAGVTVFAAWHSRFAPMVQRARDWLSTAPLVGGRMTWREDVRRWHPGQRWIWQTGGLGVFDPGINGFSLLTLLHPGPLQVHAAQIEIPRDAEMPIAARLELRGEDFTMPVELDFRATNGETWRLELQRADGAVAVLDRGGSRWRVATGAASEAPAREYAGVYTRFAMLVRGGGSELDLRPLELVEAALAIADRVSLDEPHP